MHYLKLLPLLFFTILMTACNSNDDEMNLPISEGLQGTWTLKETKYFMSSKEYENGQFVYIFTPDKVIVNSTSDNTPLLPIGTYSYTYDKESNNFTIDGIKYGLRLEGLKMIIVEPGAERDAGGFFYFVKIK